MNESISIINKSLIEEKDSNRAANKGDIINLAPEDSPFKPPALAYSSFVSRSEIVALNAGSNRAENAEEIIEPIII